MKFHNDLQDLDRISEELGIINKNQNELLANLNWEKGENNDLTQFGHNLSILYTLGIHRHHNDMFLAKFDNVMSDISKESLSEYEQNLLSQRSQILMNQLAEYSPVYCKLQKKLTN